MATSDPMDSQATSAVCEEIHFGDELDVFFLRILTGGREEMSKITDLKIIIDGSKWTDNEDDEWSIALRTFAPLCNNLEHLQVFIEGSFLFTRYNYIRPVITSMIPYGTLRNTPITETPRVVELTNDYDYAGYDLQEYRKRKVRQEFIGIHTAEKAIISALLSLHTPISKITIQGNMELNLRRFLITTLNPNWANSPHCLAQAGYAPADVDATNEMERYEIECLTTGDKLVGLSVRGSATEQDEDDFDLGNSQTSSITCPKGYDVPTSKAARQIFGWRAAAVHAWKGPA